MPLVVLDTNVILNVALKDEGWSASEALLDSVKAGENRALISTVTVNELLTPFYRVGEARRGERLLSDVKMIPNTRVVPVTEEVARTAAECRVKYKTCAGEWLALADSIVLSTGIVLRAEVLYTRDFDFVNVDVIDVRTPEGDSLRECGR